MWRIPMASRITAAQLVNAQKGSALWSDGYDRHLQGVFEIQDDIANQVVTSAAPMRSLNSTAPTSA